MGSSRFVRPDTTRLTISNGDWLLVKRRLSYGESVAAYAPLYTSDPDGKTMRRNPLGAGVAQVAAYLLDWSLTDDDGQPVVIRGVSIDELIAALHNLTSEDFTEILTAIQTHEAATLSAIAEKKITAGTPTSEPTSSSLPAYIGG